MRLSPFFNFYRFIESEFGSNVKVLVKKWSYTHINIIKTFEKIKFFKACIRFKIFPKHLTRRFINDISLQNHRSRNAFNNLRFRTSCKALRIELADAHRHLRFLRHHSLTLTHLLFRDIPVSILHNYFYKQSRYFCRFAAKESARFDRKLDWLITNYTSPTSRIPSVSYYYSIPPQPPFNPYKLKLRSSTNKPPTKPNPTLFSLNLPKNDCSGDFSHVFVDPSTFKAPLPSVCLNTPNNKWFVNLSSCNIPSDIQCLLQLGDKFSLPIKNNNLKPNVFQMIKFFESNLCKVDPLVSNDIRCQFLHVLNNFLSSPLTHSEFDKDILTKVESTRRFLSDHPDLIVTRADKGNVTVAMDRSSYIDKMELLLSDEDTYIKVNKDPTKKITNNLRTLLSGWLKNNYISIGSYRSLLLSDGVIPRAYGLPKIHKENAPLRIIVSSINSPLHRFANFLHGILYEHLPKPNSYIKNSFELVEKLNNLYIDDDYRLVSLDVVSLFTNVPTDLVIGFIAKRWHFLNGKIDIPYKEFLTALRLVVNSTFFTFNNIVYRQVFGTPMGSPLSPILADLVMQDLEEQSLSMLCVQLPFYVRYVDDIALAAPWNQIPSILDTFNSFHERLQFTVEIAENNVLNFLDVSIIINNNRIIFDWYRKPTFSGRFLSYFSQHPTSHKRGVIIGLIDRVFRLSCPIYHSRNLACVTNILLDNGYPLDFIFKIMTKRLGNFVNSSSNRGFSNNVNDTCNNNNSVLPSLSIESKKFFITPYIANLSNKIPRIANGLNFHPAFVVHNRMNKFIKLHKDRLYKQSHLNVIYKLKCKDCDASYVGQTSRQLSTRLKEHKSNIKSPADSLSVVSSHRISGHEFDWDNVDILDEEPCYKRRLLSEMLHITNQKNGLNVQADTALLDASYSWIINKFM